MGASPRSALITCWAKAFEPDPAVLRVLHDLSPRAVLFTNNGPMIDACPDGPLACLRRVFDLTICSRHLGARKHAELAFDRVAARLGTAPEHLLLLDDDPSNVAGAGRCGWNAARVIDGSDVVDVIKRFGVSTGTTSNVGHDGCMRFEDDDDRAPICPACGVTALPAHRSNVIDSHFVCDNEDCEAYGEPV